MLGEINKQIGFCLEFKQENINNSKADKRYNAGECEAYSNCREMLEKVIGIIEIWSEDSANKYELEELSAYESVLKLLRS